MVFSDFKLSPTETLCLYIIIWLIEITRQVLINRRKITYSQAWPADIGTIFICLFAIIFLDDWFFRFSFIVAGAACLIDFIKIAAISRAPYHTEELGLYHVNLNAIPPHEWERITKLVQQIHCEQNSKDHVLSCYYQRSISTKDLTLINSIILTTTESKEKLLQVPFALVSTDYFKYYSVVIMDSVLSCSVAWTVNFFLHAPLHSVDNERS